MTIHKAGKDRQKSHTEEFMDSNSNLPRGICCGYISTLTTPNAQTAMRIDTNIWAMRECYTKLIAVSVETLVAGSGALLRRPAQG